MAKSLTGPVSVPAIVKNPRTGEDEHCVYLTSPSKPNRVVRCDDDRRKPARDVGESPLPSKNRQRVRLA